MRITLLSCLLIVAVVPALAQTKPAIDVPQYPGTDVVMEVNLTKDDLVPTLSAMMPLLLSGAGKLVSAINPDDIIAIFKDVNRIQYLQLDTAKSAATESEILKFYKSKLPQGEWRRVLYMVTPKKGTISLYSQVGGVAFYGFRVQSVVRDKLSLRHIDVAEIDGLLDFQKLMSMLRPFGSASLTQIIR